MMGASAGLLAAPAPFPNLPRPPWAAPGASFCCSCTHTALRSRGCYGAVHAHSRAREKQATTPACSGPPEQHRWYLVGRLGLQGPVIIVSCLPGAVGGPGRPGQRTLGGGCLEPIVCGTLALWTGRAKVVEAGRVKLKAGVKDRFCGWRLLPRRAALLRLRCRLHFRPALTRPAFWQRWGGRRGRRKELALQWLLGDSFGRGREQGQRQCSLRRLETRR